MNQFIALKPQASPTVAILPLSAPVSLPGGADLARAADRAAGANAAKRLDAARNAAPRILIVDDDDLVRQLAVNILEFAGYAVAVAHDGFEAMRLIEITPTIDLVFTDIVMPKLDGIMLADMAKQRRPELKILYATGYRDVARARSEAGVLHGKIMEKPYRPADLEAEIERLLSESITPH